MSMDPIDPELLAAFVDGQLDDAEREAVVQRLALDPAARATLREVMAIAAALESDGPASATDAVPVTAPDTPAPAVAPAARPWRRLAPIALLAAGIAIVLVLRGPRDATPVDAMQLAQAVSVAGPPGRDRLAQSLGADWNEPGWSVTRGAESSQATGARAFRIGVRVAQFELAAQHADSTAAAAAATALESLLRDVDGAAPVAARLAHLARTGAVPDASARRELREQVAAVTGDSARFDLGMWTEAARLATLGGSMAWLKAGGAPQRALSRLLTRQAPDAAWEPLVRPLFALLENDAAGRDAAATRALLTDVIRAAAR